MKIVEVIQMWNPLGTRKSYFFRNFLVYFAMEHKFKKVFGVTHPNFMTFRQGMQFTHYQDRDDNKRLKHFLLKQCKTNQFSKNLLDSTINSAKKNIAFNRKLFHISLTKLSDRQLTKLFTDFTKHYLQLYPFFMITVSADYLEEELFKELNEMHVSNPQETILKLTSSSLPTIINLEQEEFFNICIKIETLVKTHHQRFFWLPTTDESEPWPLNYFREKIGLKDIDYNNDIQNLKSIRNEIKKERTKVQKELNLSPYHKNITAMLRTFTWLRLYSRNIFNFILTHSKPLFEEIAKRANVTFETIKFSTPNEIINFLAKGIPLDTIEQIKRIDARKEAVLFIFRNGKLSICSGNVAIQRFKQEVVSDELNAKRTDEKIQKKNDIKGVVVSYGKDYSNTNHLIKGTTKIILTTKDGYKINKGDILVARNTNPNLIDAIMKAKAIITDEGGITCHAAIVSRELGKPCIVGTKIATKALKDGDVVEIDIENGKVKRLKRI